MSTRNIVLGLSLGVTTAWACSGDSGGTDPVPTGPGSIRITVETLGVSFDPDGYRVTLNGEDRVAVAPSGSIELTNLSPGTYTVGLTELARNCADTGDAETTAVVRAGTRTDVALSVECGYLLYVSNLQSDNLTVIESVTYGVVDTHFAGNVTDGLAATPDGSQVLFNRRGQSQADTIDVLSVATGESEGRILLRRSTWELRVSPDGSEMYSVQLDNDGLTFTNLGTRQESGRIALGEGATPSDLELSPGGQLAAIPLLAEDEVVVVDLEARTVLRRLSAVAPWSVAWSMDAGTLFVGTSAEGVVALDVDTGVELARWDEQRPVIDLAVSPDGQRVYVVIQIDFVVELDASTLVQQSAAPVPGPNRLVITPQGDKIFVTSSVDRAVKSLTPNPLTEIASTPADFGPRNLVLVRERTP